MAKLPKSFGRYEILDRIAIGGMAEVFRANVRGAAGFERQVALKRILPGYSQDRDFVAMFIDEAKIASSLSHGNICQIYDLGEIDGRFFIVMENVDGKDVRCVLEKMTRGPKHLGKIPSDLAAYIAAEVCAGLDYAHRKLGSDGKAMQIVHRDVSPSNILLSFEGEVKIVDFGIAKAKEKLSRTRTGTIKGKYNYLAPEAVRGENVDHRSDVFGAGAVLYEMLTGQKAFDAPSEIRILELVRSGRYTPIRELEPQISVNLEKIVDRALRADPKKRYQSAAEMEFDLHGFLYSLRRRTSGAEMGAFVRKTFGRSTFSPLASYIPPAPIANSSSSSDNLSSNVPTDAFTEDITTNNTSAFSHQNTSQAFREEKTSIVAVGARPVEDDEEEETKSRHISRESRTVVVSNPLPEAQENALRSEPTVVGAIPLDDPLWEPPNKPAVWGTRHTVEAIFAVILGLIWLGITIQHTLF